MKLRLERPWLIAESPETRRVLSWSLNRPGFTEARRIVWREVRNADLPRTLDAGVWLSSELADAGLADCVCLVTSRDIGSYAAASISVEDAKVDVVATVGLSNAERIGARRAPLDVVGTVNIAASTTTPLSDGAMLEAMTLVAEVRTLAVLEAGLSLETGLATGTGTDCIVIMAPRGAAAHAGKHTAVGEAVGRATLEAMRQGVEVWMRENGGGASDAAD